MAILLIKDDSGVERRAELRPLPFKIGKKAGSNHLVLDHLSVSREHCVLAEENGGFSVRDLESRNGTWLNGRKLEGREALRDRDVIRIGPFTMTFFEKPP